MMMMVKMCINNEEDMGVGSRKLENGKMCISNDDAYLVLNRQCIFTSLPLHAYYYLSHGHGFHLIYKYATAFFSC